MIAHELDRLAFPATQRILNPMPERGMFSSLQCAARWPHWQPGMTHWAIVLGDQPHLKEETLARVLGLSASNPEKVCQPRYDGHRHHPVLLPQWAFLRLASSAAPDLRQFLDALSERAAFCDVSDEGLAMDLDFPADYERALKIYGPQP
jgi:CTP:molybdopterin cytidylyltransferase MocA